MTNFKYQPRPEETWEKNYNQAKNNITKAGVNFFKPKEGKNIIRICPPTWESPQHFGLNIMVHYRIGVNNESFLCLRNDIPGHEPEQCPICDYANSLDDPELKKAFSAKRKVAVYLVDRTDDEKGPKLWFMPPTLNRDICLRSRNSFSGERYNIDHPEGAQSGSGGGRDIAFEYVKQGKAGFAEYLAVSVSDVSTPLGSGVWLDTIIKNPITNVLTHTEADKLRKVVSSGSGSVFPTHEETRAHETTSFVSVESPAKLNDVFPTKQAETSDTTSRLEEMRRKYQEQQTA